MDAANLAMRFVGAVLQRRPLIDDADGDAFKALIGAAVALNRSSARESSAALLKRSDPPSPVYAAAKYKS
jgi:hypothetical protein